MSNKLVFIIHSLKLPKIKKILLHEMKFLVPNYSCLQNPWLGGYLPQIPVLSVLCPHWICWTPLPLNKIPGYATDLSDRSLHGTHFLFRRGGEQILCSPSRRDSNSCSPVVQPVTISLNDCTTLLLNVASLETVTLCFITCILSALRYCFALSLLKH